MNKNIIFCSVDTDFDPINNEGIIRNKFDQIIKSDIYTKNNCYELLYKEYELLFKNSQHIINISSDRTISAATISGLATNCIKRENDGGYGSNLKIIYIDSKPDLELFNANAEKFTNRMYRSSVVSNLLCLVNDAELETSTTYTKHSLPLEPSQFVFLGLQELSDDEQQFMFNNSVEYYELSKIGHKLEKILDSIIFDLNSYDNIAIIFDLTSLQLQIAPCTIRDINVNNIGFNLEQLNLILQKISTLSDKIRLLDITGHYLNKNTTDILTRITIETIQQIYGKIFNLKESSLNVFNDYSKFLIYKPIYNSADNSTEEIEEQEENHGWFILRGMDLKTRNEILETIGDNIILMTIPDIDDNQDIDVMITATTIAEQNEISFYATSDPNDCALFPQEKATMMFELLNNN
jgi:arginase family enzyme